MWGMGDWGIDLGVLEGVLSSVCGLVWISKLAM